MAYISAGYQNMLITFYFANYVDTRPLDFANHEWMQSRSTRELECIDIAHLQRAHQDYDTPYKMEVWDGKYPRARTPESIC